MKKTIPLILIIIIAVAGIIIKQCKKNNAYGNHSKTTTTDRENQTNNINRDRGFDRRISYIEYTEHAKCRMGCRHISQAEVEEIMKDGRINYNKSNMHSSPCPAYALEGITHDSQRVRIVFGQCDLKTKVITVIDLDTEWSCSCPGNDDQYKNRN